MNDSSSAAAAAKPITPSSLTAEECDAEVWEIFNSSFSQVRAVLDQNRVLIRQVNENHQSKIPDNMVKNVALIQELNANVSKVVFLYSDHYTNFSSAFHLRSRTSRAVDGGVAIPDPSAEGFGLPRTAHLKLDLLKKASRYILTIGRVNPADFGVVAPDSTRPVRSIF